MRNRNSDQKKIKFVTFSTFSVKFRSKKQMPSSKIPMQLQKDFDQTEHYDFKHEFRTIEVCKCRQSRLIFIYLVLEIK